MNDSHRLDNFLLVSDLSWIVVSMIVACTFRYGVTAAELPRSVLIAFTATLLEAALAWIILWSPLGLDGFRGGWRFPAIVSQLLLGVSTVLTILLASGYLLRIYVSRLLVGYFGLNMLAGVVLIRVATHAVLTMRYKTGAVRRVVIVGNGPVAQEAAAKIRRHPEALCKVVGFLAAGDSALEVLATGALQHTRTVRPCGIMALLKEQKVDELIFATPRNNNSEVIALIDQSVKNGIRVSIIPQPYELYLTTPELVDLGGLPILRLRHSAWVSGEPIWKRLLDLGVGVFLLAPCTPVVLMASIILRVKKGAGFCREERCGKGGKPFWMYRLNSPRREKNLPIHELIMQQFSITEIPQLLNVLLGDMSLVGPRPEPLESVRHYTDWQLQRLNVKPGITGLAQVHGLRDQNAVEDKTRYDLQYILHRSIFQDVSLLLQTIWTLCRRCSQLPKLSKAPTVEQSASKSSILA